MVPQKKTLQNKNLYPNRLLSAAASDPNSVAAEGINMFVVSFGGFVEKGTLLRSYWISAVLLEDNNNTENPIFLF